MGSELHQKIGKHRTMNTVGNLVPSTPPLIKCALSALLVILAQFKKIVHTVPATDKKIESAPHIIVQGYDHCFYRSWRQIPSK